MKRARAHLAAAALACGFDALSALPAAAAMARPSVHADSQVESHTGPFGSQADQESMLAGLARG